MDSYLSIFSTFSFLLWLSSVVVIFSWSFMLLSSPLLEVLGFFFLLYSIFLLAMFYTQHQQDRCVNPNLTIQPLHRPPPPAFPSVSFSLFSTSVSLLTFLWALKFASYSPSIFFYGIYVFCLLRLKLISCNFQNYFSFISNFFLSSITPNMTKGRTNQLLKWLENSQCHCL